MPTWIWHRHLHTADPCRLCGHRKWSATGWQICARCDRPPGCTDPIPNGCDRDHL